MTTLLEYFRRTRKKTASLARDRLQIIVARERGSRGAPDYLPALHQELLQVIAKYESIDTEQVRMSIDKTGECDVLELNIVLPPPEKGLPRSVTMSRVSTTSSAHC